MNEEVRQGVPAWGGNPQEARQAFEIGDKVQLKSGGPQMTVVDVGSSGTLYCRWSRDGQPHDLSLPAGAVTKDCQPPRSFDRW